MSPATDCVCRELLKPPSVWQEASQHAMASAKDTLRSLAHAFQSVTCTAACAALAPLIPLRWAFAPIWLAYGAATGTVATGMWVIAHECGHGAFSDNRRLQDAVGYFLHSLMLVPYFSWQVHST